MQRALESLPPGFRAGCDRPDDTALCEYGGLLMPRILSSEKNHCSGETETA